MVTTASISDWGISASGTGMLDSSGSPGMLSRGTAGVAKLAPANEPTVTIFPILAAAGQASLDAPVADPLQIGMKGGPIEMFVHPNQRGSGVESCSADQS